MVGVMLPITIRRMALLQGVLYLSDDAVNEVLKHMEAVSSVRNRIMKRLLGSRFLKGKPKPKEGDKLLDVIEKGEKVYNAFIQNDEFSIANDEFCIENEYYSKGRHQEACRDC